MTEGQQTALKAIVLRGQPRSGMLRLVRSLDLTWQKIRPRHPKVDKAAQERFKKGASLLA
jgi:transposase